MAVRVPSADAVPRFFTLYLACTPGTASHAAWVIDTCRGQAAVKMVVGCGLPGLDPRSTLRLSAQRLRARPSVEGKSSQSKADASWHRYFPYQVHKRERVPRF
jgi:hypothetical protein